MISGEKWHIVWSRQMKFKFIVFLVSSDWAFAIVFAFSAQKVWRSLISIRLQLSTERLQHDINSIYIYNTLIHLHSTYFSSISINNQSESTEICRKYFSMIYNILIPALHNFRYYLILETFYSMRRENTLKMFTHPPNVGAH